MFSLHVIFLLSVQLDFFPGRQIDHISVFAAFNKYDSSILIVAYGVRTVQECGRAVVE